MSSILTSTKKVCGIAEEYTVFDEDFKIHINTVFGTLNQLGLGPLDGFEIEDDSAQWEDYILDPRLNGVKTYMYLRVRMLFDPPTTSFLQESMKSQILELEWRLEVQREPVIPASPIVLPTDDIDGGGPGGDDLVYDGGSPDSPDDSDVYDGGAP